MENNPIFLVFEKYRAFYLLFTLCPISISISFKWNKSCISRNNYKVTKTNGLVLKSLQKVKCDVLANWCSCDCLPKNSDSHEICTCQSELYESLRIKVLLKRFIEFWRCFPLREFTVHWSLFWKSVLQNAEQSTTITCAIGPSYMWDTFLWDVHWNRLKIVYY